MSTYIPKPKDNVIAGSEEERFYFFATVTGFFPKDNSAIVQPMPPFEPEVVFIMQQQCTVNNIAKTFGYSTDKSIYVGDYVVGRIGSSSFQSTVEGTVVGIFPDDSVAIKSNRNNGTYLQRFSKDNISISSKGWGRWKIWL
jgi:hypothetical protein